MVELKKNNILQSISKIYLSLVALNGVAALPAESSKTDSKASDSKTSNSKTSNQKSDAKTTNTENKTEKTETTETTVTQPDTNPGVERKCQPNTNSCNQGEACVRFDTAKENVYTCHKAEEAFCDSDTQCKTNLGDKYKFCYIPPWASTQNPQRQCFSEHSIGYSCNMDIHCTNSLKCVNNKCVSPGSLDLDTGTESASKFASNGKILGINRWVFISVIAFPILVIILCLWCWLIGRRSSKHEENIKRSKYETELKKLTIPGENNEEHTKNKHKSVNDALTEAAAKRYSNPQKEIEEEVGKRGFRSLFGKKKKNEEETVDINDTVDISSSKVGGKAPINTSITTDTQQKMKKNLSLVGLSEKDRNSIGSARNRKGNNTNSISSLKSPTTPAGSKTSSVASFPASVSSTATGPRSPNGGKPRVPKKKQAPGVKKAKKGPSSLAGNDTNTNNSTSSKQSSQRGLVNNASAMSSALSGQSSSYFSGVSSMDAQSALYYQQMYNAAAAQAAAANQYYASYMQNPYYAAAAQQNAAYYAAAAQAAAAQDPNAAAAMYANYQNQQQYR